MFSKEDAVDLANHAQLYGDVHFGYCWDWLTRTRMKDPRSLEPYGYKVYSQNDEDGIINEIFKRIGSTNKKFIEFGVQDGLESNTHLLLHFGWTGLWIEGSKKYCDIISHKFKTVLSSGKLKIENEFITKDNINEIILKHFNKNEEIDLLSVDIDGNDYYIWEAITAVKPRVVVTEYNSKFPPELQWCQAYNENHVWDYSDWQGASLKSFEMLGLEKGYILVGTDIRGANAFFVRKDLYKEDLFYGAGSSEKLYNPNRTHLSFLVVHPAKYCLVDQKPNLGILNYYPFDIIDGFYPTNDEGAAWMKNVQAKFRILIPARTHRFSFSFEFPKILLEEKAPNYNVSFLFPESHIPPKEIKFTGEISAKVAFDYEVQLKDSLQEVVVTIPRLLLKSCSDDTRKFGCLFDFKTLKVDR